MDKVEAKSLPSLRLFFFCSFFFSSFSLLDPFFSLAGLLYVPPYLFLPCLMNKRLHGLSFIFIFDKEDAIFLISEFISITKEKANRQEEVLTHICLSACISRSLLFCNFLLVLAKAHYQVDLRNQTSAQQEWERKKNQAYFNRPPSNRGWSCECVLWGFVVLWLLIQLLECGRRATGDGELVGQARAYSCSTRKGQGRKGQDLFRSIRKKMLIAPPFICSMAYINTTTTKNLQEQSPIHLHEWLWSWKHRKRARDSRISLGSWEDS